MQNLSITKQNFTADDIASIDPRIQKAMTGWQVNLIHDGQGVEIPSTWNSVIYPYKYFEVYKKEGDVNGGEDENEIQLYLSCGWRGFDDEAVIVLLIQGFDVLSGVDNVSAEIYRFGGDKTKIFRHGKLVTNFVERKWWGLIKRTTHKFWIKSVNK